MKNSKLNLGKRLVGFIFVFQIVCGLAFLVSPLPAAAQTVIKSLDFTPQVTIPNSEFNGGPATVGSYDQTTGKMNSDLLARYIKAFYNYGLTIAGILATLVLMGGGVIWLASGGDAGKVGQAKEMIFGSIIGMVILVCAWIILNTINPSLVNLKSVITPVIKKVTYCCDATKGNQLMDKEGNCVNGGVKCGEGETCMNRGFNPNGAANSFACINPGNSFCCEFESMDFKYCGSVKTGRPCSDITPPRTSYSYKKSYTGAYCPSRETLADACYPEECQGKDDGDDCGLENFCYKEICWYGRGKINEPCGNDNNSKCLANGSRCDNHDYVGGRICGSGLFCCNKVVEN